MKFNNKYIFGLLLVIFYLVIEVSGSYISNYLFSQDQAITSPSDTEKSTNLASRIGIRDLDKINSIKKQAEDYKNNTYKELPPPLCRDNKNVKCFGEKNTDSYKYVGHLLNDQPHGSGHIKYSDSSKYIGEFKDGFQDGYGVSYDEFDRVIYDGDWHEDDYNGKGILYFGAQYYDGFFNMYTTDRKVPPVLNGFFGVGKGRGN